MKVNEFDIYSTKDLLIMQEKMIIEWTDKGKPFTNGEQKALCARIEAIDKYLRGRYLGD